METRLVKSDEEIELIRAGAAVADIGGYAIREAIVPGATEVDIAQAGRDAMEIEILHVAELNQPITARVGQRRRFTDDLSGGGDPVPRPRDGLSGRHHVVPESADRVRPGTNRLPAHRVPGRNHQLPGRSNRVRIDRVPR